MSIVTNKVSHKDTDFNYFPVKHVDDLEIINIKEY